MTAAWRWGILGSALLILVLFAVKAVLLPFVMGLAIAYLLDPLADRLEGWGVKRGIAAFLIIVGFFLLAGGLVLVIWPLTSSQVGGVIDAVPAAIERIKPMIHRWIDQAGQERVEQLLQQLPALSGDLARQLGEAVLARSLALVNLLGLLLISPVVAFYLLRDWDLLVARIESWLPRAHEPVLKRLLNESDRVLAGFVRGQLLVALAEMALYAGMWGLLGLNFWFVLGLIAGALAVVPFVGPLLGVLLALLVGVGQYHGDWLQLSLIFGVLLVVQSLEGMFLIPKLVGDRVGLHAVSVLFAVMVGGHLLGFVGVLIAVPVAAVVAVLARFGLGCYLDSRFYRGPTATP